MAPAVRNESSAVQFPNYADEFDATAPEFLRGCSPPFLTALPEAGAIQMWTGLLAKTRPGWSLSVRPPVNIPAIPGIVPWEGIIETDIWFGPVFTNFGAFTKTDMTVHIRAREPIIQLQPVLNWHIGRKSSPLSSAREVTDLSDADWHRLGEVLLPHPNPTIRQGEYTVTVRKRRMCPFDPALLARPKTSAS